MTHLPNCYRCGEQPCECKDGITLYHADSLELLPFLKTMGISAVVADPPYGIGYHHHGGVGDLGFIVGRSRGQRPGPGAANRRGCPKIRGDDRPFDPTPWLKFPRVLLWGADHFCGRLPSDAGTWLAWDKAVDHRSPADSFVDVEFAWTNRKIKRNIFRFLWKGLVVENGRAEHNGLRWHPTQKPESLMRWCVRLVTERRDVILDPFCGSGTTLRAAKDLGRRAIGIEIEERWVKIAARRLRQEVLALAVP